MTGFHCVCTAEEPHDALRIGVAILEVWVSLVERALPVLGQVICDTNRATWFCVFKGSMPLGVVGTFCTGFAYS